MLIEFIKIEEVLEVVQHHPKKKSPGPDGIPYEVYEAQKDVYAPVLTRLFNFCLEREGACSRELIFIVCLLYKKGSPEELKNWRPITLTNTDAKLLTKTLTNRLNKQTPHLISQHQFWFTPGRSIMTSISIIKDILQITTNEGGGLLFLDTKKEYDRMALPFLFECSTKFGFPRKFREWMKTIYYNLRAKVLLGEERTRDINIEQGLRQVDPLSPTLFNFTTEIFLRMLAQELRGVKIVQKS